MVEVSGKILPTVSQPVIVGPCRVQKAFTAKTPEELSVSVAQLVEALAVDADEREDGWTLVVDLNGDRGLVPTSYLEQTQVSGSEVSKLENKVIVGPCRVLEAFNAETPDELSVRANQLVEALVADEAEREDGWTLVVASNGERGLVPTSYLEPAQVHHQQVFDFEDNDDMFEVIETFSAEDEVELSVEEGEHVQRIKGEESSHGWTFVQNSLGAKGLVPSDYLRPLPISPKQPATDGLNGEHQPEGQCVAEANVKEASTPPCSESEAVPSQPIELCTAEAEAASASPVLSECLVSGQVLEVLEQFSKENEVELSVRSGEHVKVVSAAEHDDGWTLVCNECGKQGLVPTTYLRSVPSSKPLPAGLTVEVFEVLEQFDAENEVELTVRSGQAVWLVEGTISSNGWTAVNTDQGKQGLVPTDFLKLIGQSEKSCSDAGREEFEVLEEFNPENKAELSVRTGERVWFQGTLAGEGWTADRNQDCSRGFVPSDYVRPAPQRCQDDVRHEYVALESFAIENEAELSIRTDEHVWPLEGSFSADGVHNEGGDQGLLPTEYLGPVLQDAETALSTEECKAAEQQDESQRLADEAARLEDERRMEADAAQRYVHRFLVHQIEVKHAEQWTKAEEMHRLAEELKEEEQKEMERLSQEKKEQDQKAFRMLQPAAIRVTILGGTILRGEDDVDNIDPFVSCRISSKEELQFETPIAEDTENPVWNFSSIIPEIQPVDSLILELSEYDPDGEVQIIKLFNFQSSELLSHDLLHKKVLFQKTDITSTQGDLQVQTEYISLAEEYAEKLKAGKEENERRAKEEEEAWLKAREAQRKAAEEAERSKLEELRRIALEEAQRKIQEEEMRLQRLEAEKKS